jgi:hypothetical protein
MQPPAQACPNRSCWRIAITVVADDLAAVDVGAQAVARHAGPRAVWAREPICVLMFRTVN